MLARQYCLFGRMQLDCTRVLLEQLDTSFGKRAIDFLQFGPPLIQLDENGDFTAQDLGCDRHGDIVNCANFVAAQSVDVATMNGGDEDD